MTDTADRSLQHWSEAKRRGMEDFYRLATLDYVTLANALDWKTWIEGRQRLAGDRPLRLLDVACGSGKFPTALVEHAGLAAADLHPVDYALLDPSRFSLAEARGVLKPPFAPGAEYNVPLQDLDTPPRAFDVVWATHALYALPRADLPDGLARFVRAIGGAGFIAHAAEDAHYLRFYRAFLDGFRGDDGAPYISAEELLTAFEPMGVDVSVREVTYVARAPDADRDSVEGYLQRCVFDDTVSLDDMLANDRTGPYLQACYQDGEWRFRQRVQLIFLKPR